MQRRVGLDSHVYGKSTYPRTIEKPAIGGSFGDTPYEDS